MEQKLIKNYKKLQIKNCDRKEWKRKMYPKRNFRTEKNSTLVNFIDQD